jgi:Domain of unknown function (DUF4259)
MGTWGHNPLENDDASDFAANFNESKDILVLERAFDAVCKLKDDEYLEAPAAQEAVAAAQLLRGLDDSQISPEESARLKDKSDFALKRVLKSSELKELWTESPEYNDWIKSVEALLVR